MEQDNLFEEPEDPPSSVGSEARRLRLSLPRRARAAQAAPRFVVSKRSRSFHKTYFPTASLQDWNDWTWQNRNRLTSLARLERVLELTADERAALVVRRGSLPVGITPYYASLLSGEDGTALRKTVVPTVAEFSRTAGEADDPLGEDGHAVVPGLVHRYPDRVLLLVNNHCATYCRYCTRSRAVGSTDAARAVTHGHWERAIEYIRTHAEVRDVLLSGGDPLTLSDQNLERLLTGLRAVPHVELLRIGTKVPVVLPQRVTPALVRMLRRFHPLWMSIHFTHPVEITPEVAQACQRLADAGLPLGGQSVLLAGVNDSVETMKALVHGMLKIRVRPYYLYQCDPISGSSHFRTPVAKGLEIIQGLRGHTTGYAVPTFVIDAPGGGGKIPLLPAYVAGREGDDLLLVNFEGGQFRYPDPPGRVVGPAGEAGGEASCASA